MRPMILEVRYIGVRSAMVKTFQITTIFSLILIPLFALLISQITTSGVIIITASSIASVAIYYLFLCVLIGSVFASIIGAIAYVYNLTCRWWGGGVEIVLGKAPDQQPRTPAD